MCRDNTIAWQPNNQQQPQQQPQQQLPLQQQQTNVSVTVSSVWDVTSTPSLVNPMMTMQSGQGGIGGGPSVGVGGGGMAQAGVAPQYDMSGNQMKPMPNQGIYYSPLYTCYFLS